MKYIVIIFFCALIAIYDLKTMQIPDIILIFFSITMIIVEENIFNHLFLSRMAALTLSFLLFGSVWCYTQGIGFGDVKYASILGFFLGLENLLFAFLITSCLGLCVYLLAIFISRLPKSAKIPYAPFLSAGAIFAAGGGL